ncbi:hypothetical protein TorRG33x02_275140 [Trema orientale]|uniref:Uncharacterized protein n=1 Tax=Trema orientale TaxID=63057 RepID=A0A2P5CRX9_TREOI|nr:hypothetical protein TorRG33x02_275140 [Trema orientale]
MANEVPWTVTWWQSPQISILGACVGKGNQEVRWLERAFLSKGSQLTLIESALLAIPTYYLSLCCIPTMVAKDIEKVMRDFLWNDGNDEKYDHLVAWEDVCRPKDKGGLWDKISWLECNRRIFDRAEESLDSLWDRIRLCVAS